MIIKVLLFIIVLLFAYESFQLIRKTKEEYFTQQTIGKNIVKNIVKTKDNFVSLSSDPDENDIAKTIAINCKAYSTSTQGNLVKQINSINPINPINPINLLDNIDTPEYAQFKPLEYNPDRKYYWRRDLLVPEGIRRSLDDETEIAKVQALFDVETDIDKKQILQDELDLFKWRTTILASNTKEGDRSMRDITTDYFPDIIGMNRAWKEPHSHIPDYSQLLNYGVQNKNKKNKNN